MSDDESLPLSALLSDPRHIDRRVCAMAVEFLRFLLLEHRAELLRFFPDLPAIPRLSCLQEVAESVQSASVDVGVLERLTQLMRTLEHESQDVRAGALSQLHSLFLERSQELDGYSLDGSYAETVSTLLSCLLRLSNHPSSDIQRLAGLCLGEPGRDGPCSSQRGGDAGGSSALRERTWSSAAGCWRPC